MASHRQATTDCPLRLESSPLGVLVSCISPDGAGQGMLVTCVSVEPCVGQDTDEDWYGLDGGVVLHGKRVAPKVLLRFRFDSSACGREVVKPQRGSH